MNLVQFSEELVDGEPAGLLALAYECTSEGDAEHAIEGML